MFARMFKLLKIAMLTLYRDNKIEYFCVAEKYRYTTMKSKLSSITIIFVVILCACSRRYDDRPAGTSPIKSDNISNQFVYDIAEDSTGQIWIGTFRGLNRYNSREFYQYFEGDDSLSLPNNQVRDILVTRDGRVYVATVSGLCRLTDMDDFRNIPLGDKYMIVGLAEMADSTVVAVSAQGLMAYHPGNDSVEKLSDRACPGSMYILKPHVNAKNELWIAGEYSLACYDIKSRQQTDSLPTGFFAANSFLVDNREIWLTGQTLKRFDTYTRSYIPLPEAIAQHPVLSRSGVEFIHPYGTGILIQSSGDGMFYYDAAKNRVTAQEENDFPVNVPDFKIKMMFTDSRRNLWFGGHDQGVAVHYHYTERFNRNKYVSNALAGKSVVSTAIDHDNNLWMATRHGGVYVYDYKAGSVSHMPFSYFSSARNIYDEAIKNIFIDSDNRIWLTLTSSEVIQGKYSAGRLILEKRFIVWGVMSICEDANGTIWLGTGSPYVYYLRRDDNEFRHLQVFDSGFCFIPGVMPYDADHIMVAAFGNMIKLVDINTLEVGPLPESERGLSQALKSRNFIPTDLCRDADGIVWIGTVANGLIKYNPADSSFTAVPGAACSDISAIRADSDSTLWISTLDGLSHYSPRKKTFEHFYEHDGTGGNQFYDRSAAVDSAGNFYLGGTHGVTSFNPGYLSKHVKAKLLFQNLMVHNKPVRPGGGIIDTDFSLAPVVRLDHESNSFGISFVAVDFCENPRVDYRYMLEGIDKGWVEASGSHEAYYANVPAGNYIFRVGIVGDDTSEISLKVIVERPWWFSWWAICCYILFFAGIVGVLVMMSIKIRAERLAVSKVRRDKERERHINDMNMRFFANISHEFRTPLTMISGPIKQLVGADDISADNKHLLAIAETNVNRMLNLVNQLLDFNKLENDTLPLEVERIDIAAMLRRISDTFACHAAGKEINFAINGMEDNCFATVDADKIMKIYYNLLSNALKFTPRGGSITVGLDTVDHPGSDGSLKIYVRNTGQRIPSDKLEKIFERYYQLDGNTSSGSYNCGTGIGLYYARALARLHHGTLKAVDNPSFEGAEFELVIPAGNEAYASDQHKTTPTQSIAYPLAPDNRGKGDDDDDEESKQTVLVVDDDIQVAEYMRSLLSANYKVVTRFDVAGALEWLSENIPALIISDVVMPGTDGYELCRTIKDDLRFSHIPVILLTAKATPENQVEGLEAEADAYITKPFDPAVLMSQIGSLLRNRERARRMITAGTTVEDVDKDVISPRDGVFLKDLYAMMENELTNSEIDVNEIARMMNMSRTKFYYKVKGLTGEPPSVFFKTYKLNRAAELIKEHKYTLSEISDMTGFSSLSHFSRSFKKQFGTNPSLFEV